KALRLARVLDDLQYELAVFLSLGHEEVSHCILADRGQLDAELCHFLAIKAVRNLDHDASAVTHGRVGTDSTTVRQVLEHRQAVLVDLEALDVLHLRNEADAAGISLISRIIKAVRIREPPGHRGAFEDGGL